MRLNNNLLKEQKNELLIAFALGAVTTFILWAIYVSNVQEQSCSFINFFVWFVNSIHSLLLYSDIMAKILIILFCVCLPIGVYLCCFAYVIKYCVAVKKLAEETHIKAVDLLPDRVCFNYSNAFNNVICKFEEIKKVDMNVVLSGMNVYSDGVSMGGGYMVDNITFTFVKNDNTELSVCMTPFPFYVMSFIFSVVDYCKTNHLDLTYNFVSVDGQTNAMIKEFQIQVDNYKKNGKPGLTENERKFVLIFSAMLYVLGLGLIINFKNNVVNFPQDFGLVIFIIPIFISVVMDVFYILDKKGFKDVRVNNNIFKYYEIFLLIKILLVIVIVASYSGLL